MRLTADIMLYSGDQQGQPAKSSEKLEHDWRRMKSLLERVGQGAGFEQDSISYSFHNLEVGSEAFNILIAELQPYPDLVSYAHVIRHYQRQELKLAELLWWTPTNEIIEDDYSNFHGKDMSTDQVAESVYKRCPVCGSPLEQIRELKLNKALMRKRAISMTYMNEVVLSEPLGRLLQEHDLSGFRLTPIQNYKNRYEEEPILYQLTAINILPAMLSPPTEFERVQECASCHLRSQYLKQSHWWGKIKYYGDSDIYYPRAVLEVAKDFNRTAEWFGEQWSMHPMIVIAQRVYRLFLKHKVKDWQAIPVRLVE